MALSAVHRQAQTQREPDHDCAPRAVISAANRQARGGPYNAFSRSEEWSGPSRSDSTCLRRVRGHRPPPTRPRPRVPCAHGLPIASRPTRGQHTVAYRIFNQRLKDERRDEGAERLRLASTHGVKTRTKAVMLNAQYCSMSSISSATRSSGVSNVPRHLRNVLRASIMDAAVTEVALPTRVAMRSAR